MSIKPGHSILGIMLCTVLTISAYAAENREFELAVEAYAHGDYAIARIYFENILDDNNNREFFPDALYHLITIHIQEGDFTGFLSSTGNFLNKYNYDSRAGEVFTLLMHELIRRSAFLVAYEYLLKYDFLLGDYSLVEEIGRSLLAHGEAKKADHILSFCEQTDTVKILRAMTRSDLGERAEIFGSLQGLTRDLYLTENLLLMGDTVNAFLSFRNIAGDNLRDDGFYRYAKIALLFVGSDFSRHVRKLHSMSGYDRKADLLYALAGTQPLTRLLPLDEEETSLFVRIYTRDTVLTGPPEEIPLDSILHHTEDTLSRIREVRKYYKDNYYLDSMYCQHLMARGEYEQAYDVIGGYLMYRNTEPYVRKVVGFNQYSRGNYESAARHIILSRYQNPEVLFVLAECYRKMGKGVADLYADIMSQNVDSLLMRKR